MLKTCHFHQFSIAIISTMIYHHSGRNPLEQHFFSIRAFLGSNGLVVKRRCISISVRDCRHKTRFAINVIGYRHEPTVSQPHTVLSFNTTWVVLRSPLILSPVDSSVLLVQLSVVFAHTVGKLVRHRWHVFILGKWGGRDESTEEDQRIQLHPLTPCWHLSLILLLQLEKDSPC